MPITYQVIRSNRKTLAIQILPTGKIVVRSPRRARQDDIRAFVESKSNWIETHLARIQSECVSSFKADELEDLRQKTKVLVLERVQYFASVMGVSYNRISVRAQHTRWGSCSNKGNLNFNCVLSLVPPDVLDYVVVHELCHLRFMNHSGEFWLEVEKYFPDFKKCRKWLREEGSALINRIQ